MSNSTGGSPNDYNLNTYIFREATVTNFVPQEAYGSYASPEDPVIPPPATAAGDSLTAVPSNLEVKDGQVDIDFIVGTSSKEIEFAVRVPTVSTQIETVMRSYYTGLKVVCSSGTGCSFDEIIENVTHLSPADCTDADCAAYDDGSEHTIRFDYNGTSIDVYIDNMVTPKWTTAGLQTQTETNQTGYITMRAKDVKLTISQITVAEDEDEWANTYEYWNCNHRPVTFNYHGIAETSLSNFIPLKMFRDDVALAKTGGFNPVTRNDVLNWLSDCTTFYLPENPIMYRHDDSNSGNVLTAMAPTAASAGIGGVSVGTDQYRTGDVNNEVTTTDLDHWGEMGLFLHWDFEIGSEEESAVETTYLLNSQDFINTAINADLHDEYYGMGAITLDPYNFAVYPTGGSMNGIGMRPDTLTLAAAMPDSWLDIAHSPFGGINYYAKIKNRGTRRNPGVFASDSNIEPAINLEKFKTVDRLAGDYRFQKIDLMEYLNATANRTDTHYVYDGNKTVLDFVKTEDVNMDFRPDNPDHNNWDKKSDDTDYNEQTINSQLFQSTTGTGYANFNTAFGDDSLVSHWKLEEADGVRYDETGNNHLNEINTVENIAAVFGNGADFEATNNEYLVTSLADQVGLDGMEELTVSIWYKPETTPAGLQYAIITKNAGGEGQSWGLMHNTDGTVKCSVKTDDTAWTGIDSSTTLSTGTDYHIACTYDGANTKIYINGGAAETTSGSITGNINKTSADLQVGGLAAGSGWEIDGVLDDAAVWRRALSQAEITSLYNSGTGTEVAATSSSNTYLEARVRVDKATTDYTGNPFISFGQGRGGIEFAVDEMKVDISVVPPRPFAVANTDFERDVTTGWTCFDSAGGACTNFNTSDTSAYTGSYGLGFNDGSFSTLAEQAVTVTASTRYVIKAFMRGGASITNVTLRIRTDSNTAGSNVCSTTHSSPLDEFEELTCIIPDTNTDTSLYLQLHTPDVGGQVRADDITINSVTINETFALDTSGYHTYGLDMGTNGISLYYDGAFLKKYSDESFSASAVEFGLSSGSASQQATWDYVTYGTSTTDSGLRRYDYGVLTTPILLGNIADFKVISWTEFLNGTGLVSVRMQSCDDAACASGSGWLPSANRLVLDAMDSGWTSSDGGNTVVTHPGGTVMKIATTDGSSNDDYASKSVSAKDVTAKDLLTFTVQSDTAGCDKFRVLIGESSDIADASISRTLCIDRVDTDQDYYVDISRHVSPLQFDNYYPMDEIDRRYDVPGAVDFEESGTVAQAATGKFEHAATFDNNASNYLSATTATDCSGADNCTFSAWINHTGSGVVDYYFDSDYLEVYTDTSDQFVCRWDGTDTTTFGTAATGGSTYDLVICSYDTAGNASISMNNGTPVTTSATVGTLSVDATSRFGLDEADGGAAAGSLDEVIFDAETWSAEHEAYVYNSGAGREFRTTKGRMDMDVITHLFFQVVDDTGSPTLTVDDLAADRLHTTHAGSLETGYGVNKPYHQFEFILTSSDQERTPSMWDSFNLLFQGAALEITAGGGGNFDGGFD
jgi:hypothetical protein